MRACIYNRCSTEEEAQINALGIQVEESREIVEKNGWVLTGQYVESQSGTTSYRRSEYQKLLSDMESDLFDVVVVKSIDRLTRCAKDWYLFLDKMTRNGKKLYIYMDQKFYTPNDNLLAGIKAILAEDFSRELSKKIKNAHRRRQEKQTGLNITVPIFGWDKVGKDTYVLNEEEANAYRRAFFMAEEGTGFYTIAKQMYEQGVRSKRGGRISEVQWRKMIYSPRAHGSVFLHTSEYDFEAKKHKMLPKEEWIEVKNALPPIVSSDYQEMVLKKLGERTKKNHFRDYTRNMTKIGLYPLSGKIYCAECGQTYYRSKLYRGTEERIVWKCSTYLKEGRKAGCKNPNLPEERIVNFIKSGGFSVTKRVCMKEEVLKLLETALTGEDGSKRILQIERRLEKIQQKQKVLAGKWLDELITEEEYYLFRRELNEEQGVLQTRIERLKHAKEQSTNIEERLQNIKRELEEGILDEALVYERLLNVEKVIVFRDGNLKVQFQ